MIELSSNYHVFWRFLDVDENPETCEKTIKIIQTLNNSDPHCIYNVDGNVCFASFAEQARKQEYIGKVLMGFPAWFDIHDFIKELGFTKIKIKTLHSSKFEVYRKNVTNKYASRNEYKYICLDKGDLPKEGDKFVGYFDTPLFLVDVSELTELKPAQSVLLYVIGVMLRNISPVEINISAGKYKEFREAVSNFGIVEAVLSFTTGQTNGHSTCDFLLNSDLIKKLDDTRYLEEASAAYVQKYYGHSQTNFFKALREVK